MNGQNEWVGLYFFQMTKVEQRQTEYLCQDLNHSCLYIYTLRKQMYQIQDLIEKAIRDSNNATRKQAEAALIQLRNQNPTEFFILNAKILEDNSKKQFIRQSSGVLVAKLIRDKDHKNNYFWDLIESNAREEIKQCCLSTLISDDPIIMRTGANIISQIAAIEIPKNQWLNIIEILAENTSNDQLNIQNASITTLGFVCQQLKEIPNLKMPNSSCENILSAIIVGSRNNNINIVKTSIIALRDSISFLYHILQNKNYRDEVFRILLQKLNHQFLNRPSYEALFQFCKYCYFYLEEYIQDMVKFSLLHLGLRNEITNGALELWDVIGTEFQEKRIEARSRVNQYQQNIPNYIQKVSNIILPEIMKCVLILDKNDLDNSQMRSSAIKTLGTFVEVCQKDVADKVMEGASVIIKSPNAGERQASAPIFACVCEYQDKDYVENCFKNGFDFLYSLLNDPQFLVRKNTLNGFLTLSESFPRVFLERQDLREITAFLLKLVNNSEEDIRIFSLIIFLNITEEKGYNSLLVQDPTLLLKHMVEYLSNNIIKHNVNSKETNQKVIAIIMNIVMATDNRDVITNLVEFMIGKYNDFSRAKIDDKQIILEFFLTIIHTCTLSLSKSLANEKIFSGLLQVLDAHISQYGVESESIHMIGAISSTYKNSFKSKLDYYWKFVMQGLTQIEQKPVFRAALSCAADIARCHDQYILEKLHNAFKILVNYINSNNIIERQLKTDILRCFGDLSLGMKRSSQSFLDIVIEICDKCFEAVYQLQGIENEKQYAEELKESLIDMYHCFVFAVNENQSSSRRSHINPKLVEHFPIVATFIVRTCKNDLKPTVEYLKTCLELIYDSFLFYDNIEKYKITLSNILESNEIKNMMETLKKYQDRPEVRAFFQFMDSHANKFNGNANQFNNNVKNNVNRMG